jgi:SPP1 gp7 family putative phage head morphogenesis protein
MKAFFDRHQGDKDATGFSSGEEGYPSPGRVAWDAWGGDAGYSWVRGIVGEEKAQISDTPKGRSLTKRKVEDLPGHKLKQKVIDYYSPLIVKALVSGYSGLKEAVDQAVRAHPAQGLKPVAKIVAQQAVQHNVRFDAKKFESVLTDLYADNGLIAMETNPVIQKGAGLTDDLKSLAGGIDWSTWKPGSPGAAAKVAGGGLKDLLDATSTTIKGINDTTLARIGDAIANGLIAGENATDATLAILRSVDELLADPSRAEMIAITEGNRAYSASSIDSMKDAELPGFVWLAYDGACEDCAEMEGDHDFGDEYPPLHPNCRCAVVGQSTVSADEIAAEEEGTSPSDTSVSDVASLAQSLADNAANPLYNPVLDGFSQGAPRSIDNLESWINDVNPNYETGKTAWTNNCARVVQNAELNMRGIFTEANEADLRGNSQVASEYIQKTWKDAQGRSAISSTPLRATAKIEENLTKEILANNPEGARGFLRMRYKGNSSGHVINWVVKDGKVKFIDFQVRRVWEPNDRMFKLMSKPQWARIDNLRPTDNILEYIKGGK